MFYVYRGILVYFWKDLDIHIFIVLIFVNINIYYSTVPLILIFCRSVFPKGYSQGLLEPSLMRKKKKKKLLGAEPYGKKKKKNFWGPSLMGKKRNNRLGAELYAQIFVMFSID